MDRSTIEKFTTRKDKATAAIEKLTEEIATLQSELATIAKQQAEMDGMRADTLEFSLRVEPGAALESPDPTGGDSDSPEASEGWRGPPLRVSRAVSITKLFQAPAARPGRRAPGN